jgi:hypothetical protein
VALDQHGQLIEPARSGQDALEVGRQGGFREDKLLDVQSQFTGGKFRAPEFACDQCVSPMEFDDLTEMYLSFLNES